MPSSATDRIVERYSDPEDPHFTYWVGQVQAMFVPPRLRPVLALNYSGGPAYANAVQALPAEEQVLIFDAFEAAVEAVDAILVRIREEMLEHGTPEAMLAIKVAEQIRQGRLRIPRWCEWCERPLEPDVRGDARFHPSCRVAAHRARNR